MPGKATVHCLKDLREDGRMECTVKVFYERMVRVVEEENTLDHLENELTCVKRSFLKIDSFKVR